jgi:hypothetical protein
MSGLPFLSEVYCLCNDPESDHGADEGACTRCHCLTFEADVCYEPHSQHRALVVGCESCENLLAEAREVEAELREEMP